MTAEDITLTVTPAAGKPGRFVVEARGPDGPLHLDTLDLSSATRRAQFVKHALKAAGVDEKGGEWAALAKDIERRLLAAAVAPPGDPAPRMEPAEDDPRAAALDKMPDDVRAEAEELLDDPDLMRRVRTDIRTVGVVGESNTALLLYLIGTSAQLGRPLSGIVRGPSTSGKSFVVERVSGMFPPEILIRATSLTTNALYYFPPGFLRHKWVVAGERSRVEDDQTAETTRALREMIESGRLSKAVPQKTDDRMATELIEQEGPIAFVETTTLANIFDEDANRCLLLSTDERESQTRLILSATAEAAAGRSGGDADRVRAVHHAVQRMLPRCDAVVPFADAVGALYPAARIESRRDFRHLVQLVKAVALLHFRQRERNAEGKVVATLSDYEDAEQLARGPLGAAAGGVSDGARRFLDTLRERFRDSVPDTWREFTTTEAKSLNKSRSPVYGWLGELSNFGAVEQTQAGKGKTPARWRLVRPDQCPDLGGSGIPSADEVRERFAERTHGREQ